MTLTSTPEHKTTTMMFPLPPCTMRPRHTSLPCHLKTTPRAAKSGPEHAFGTCFGENSLSLRTLILINEFPRNMGQQQRKRGLRGRFFQKVVSRAGRSKLKSASPKPVRRWALGLPWEQRNAATAAQATKTTTATITMATTATVTMATATTATATTATAADQEARKGDFCHGYGSRYPKRRPR